MNSAVASARVVGIHLVAFIFICLLAAALMSFGMGGDLLLILPLLIGVVVFGAVFAAPVYLVAASGVQISWQMATAAGFAAGAFAPALGGSPLGVAGLGLLGAFCASLFWRIVAPFTYSDPPHDLRQQIGGANLALLVLALSLIAIGAKIYFEEPERKLNCGDVPSAPDGMVDEVFSGRFSLSKEDWPTFEAIVHGFTAEQGWDYLAHVAADEERLEISTCNEIAYYFFTNVLETVELRVTVWKEGEEWREEFAEFYGRIKRRWPNAELIGWDGKTTPPPEWLVKRVPELQRRKVELVERPPK